MRKPCVLTGIVVLLLAFLCAQFGPASAADGQDPKARAQIMKIEQKLEAMEKKLEQTQKTLQQIQEQLKELRPNKAVWQKLAEPTGNNIAAIIFNTETGKIRIVYKSGTVTNN